MKKIYFLGMLLISIMFSSATFAQVSNYTFSTSTSNSLETGSFTNLLGTDLDDDTSALTNIGFTFYYNSIPYTTFSATSNGILQFGGFATSAFSNNTSSLSGPYLLPYWDDNYTDSNGNVQYLVTGVSGSRKLVVEYNLSYLGTTGTADKHFQIWLYETSNVVQFVYGLGNNINSNFSVGILTSGTSDFQSVTTTTNTSSTTVQNDSNTVWPGNGTSYIFNGLPTATGETNVIASQCGFTMLSNSTIVYANLVSGAQAYRFRVTNLATNVAVVKDYALRNLYMSSLSNFKYNQTYSVEVSVKKAGVFGPYGSSCTITTPNALTQLRAADCGAVKQRNNIVYADLVSLAQGYRFKVVNLNTGSEQIIDRSLRSLYLTSITDYSPIALSRGIISAANSYNISVAVKNTDGTYLDYGSSCYVEISSGSSSAVARGIDQAETETFDAFKAVAYPNPFDNSFKLELNSNSTSKVSIVIYDMIGKQVENREISASDVNNIEIGQRLTTGIYNVVLSQDGNIQTLRMAKR